MKLLMSTLLGLLIKMISITHMREGRRNVGDSLEFLSYSILELIYNHSLKNDC
jgi:hypothetical protein